MLQKGTGQDDFHSWIYLANKCGLLANARRKNCADRHAERGILQIFAQANIKTPVVNINPSYTHFNARSSMILNGVAEAQVTTHLL